MPPDMTPLTQAFVHQSLAAAKNRVRSQKAAQDGQPGAALALLALAEAQEVHARKALTFLRGRIGSSAENLALALQEAREMAVNALGWTLQSEADADKAAGSLLTQMARAVQSHLTLPGIRQAGSETRYHVCVICGHVHAGDAPGRCPVCQAVPEKFREVRV
jgi:rubrerythrin